MRGKRVKWIKDLVVRDDPSLLLTIRNYYGTQTEKFNDSRIYRKAKKLYSRSVSDVKNWGKVFTNLSSMKVEETVNGINNDKPVI
jgi:hypothetical protein